jgi:deoxyhypusine synthase
VPKNFIQQIIQQTEATVGDYSGSDSYPIQHNTDAPHYIRRACHLSGLSGCTFEEAVS